MTFQTVNANNQGDYFFGLGPFVPNTCRAGDDITRPFGDPREASTAVVASVQGGDRLTRELEPNHCAMISVRKVEPNPQVVSTNRHILQGWVDLAEVKWDAASRKLSGTAKVIGSEPFRIVLAGNGRKPIRASANDALARIESHPAGGELTTLVMERKDNGETRWSVEFE